MKLINDYLEEKEKVWSPTTYQSESCRLRVMRNKLDWEPVRLYEWLVRAEYRPYSIKTLFTRLSAMMQWAKQEDKYGAFMKQTRSLRTAYQRRRIPVSYEEAVSRINRIKQSKNRAHAMFLLETGVRIGESASVIKGEDGHYYVRGKGGEVRRIFGTPPAQIQSRDSLRRALRGVGLRPHDLRKIFATKLIRSGMMLQDVCKVLGWRNIQTAMKYLQNLDDNKLEQEIKQMIKAPHNENAKGN